MQNKTRTLLLLLLAGVALSELAFFLLSLFAGDLEEFVSAKIQVCVLTLGATLGASVAIFQFLAPGVSDPAPPAHAHGCHQCGNLSAEEYATEYGWYETTEWSGGTTNAYVPLGTFRVRLCEPCVARQEKVTSRRNRRNAVALLAACLPAFLGSLALLSGPIDREVGIFVWIALIPSGTALAIVLLAVVVRVFVGIAYLVGGSRLRKSDRRAFAKSWAWTLVESELRAPFMEGQEQTHDYRVWYRVGPRSPEVDLWPQAAQTITPRYRVQHGAKS